MKKILSIITAAVMIFCLFPPVKTFAADTQTVEYIEYVSDGKGGAVPQQGSVECTALTSDAYELSDGWYVADGNVSLKDRIQLSGTVNFILKDDCTLTANFGIHLPKGSTLNIYAQSKGTGSLTSIDRSLLANASIGGNPEESCGTLNIHGGIIKAESYCVGIGGGGYNGNTFGGGEGGDITIYSGSLTAVHLQDPTFAGMAIGAGGNALFINNRGSLTIYGGTVTANDQNADGTALGCVPTFGSGYSPRVSYGSSASDVTTENPPADTSIYTSSAYVSIKPQKQQAHGSVPYVNYVSDGTKLVPSSDTAECTLLSGDNMPSELSEGWYAIDESISISDRLNISGTVNLILTDNYSFSDRGGIRIAEGNTLNIYAQNGGSGSLSVSASISDTAIGGNKGENSGTLNIYGGNISATNFNGEVFGTGGSVNVYNGTLKANTEGAAAISGSLNIYGGSVDAFAKTTSSAAVAADVRLYGGSLASQSLGNAALSGKPTFGAGYMPKVTYRKLVGIGYRPVTEIYFDESVYTLNQIKIENAFINAEYDNVGWDGLKTTGSFDHADCIELSDKMFLTTLTSGWYCIKRPVDKSSETLTIQGDVKLVLHDTLTVQNLVIPKGSTLTLYGYGGMRLTVNEEISDPNGNGGTLILSSTNIVSNDISDSSASKLGSLINYSANCTFKNDLICPDIRMYADQARSGTAYFKSSSGNALSSAPKFIGYVPKVTYTDKDGNTFTGVVDPPSSVYTSSKDVTIRLDHAVPICNHSANTNPTCEGANCSVCGTYIAPTGHIKGDPVIENETEAVCEIGGSYDEVIYCSVCGKELSRETKTVEAKGHIPAEPVIENQTAAVCTEGGIYDEVVYCSVCKTELSRVTKTTEALGHIEGDWEVISAPTTSSVGTRVIKCKVCGEILKTETIPQIVINIPQTITASITENSPAKVTFSEFEKLKLKISAANGRAVLTWNSITGADEYVVYAVRNGVTAELERTENTAFETKHINGTEYLVRYRLHGVLSPRSKTETISISGTKPLVAAVSEKDLIRLSWQDMEAEKYSIYKLADGKAVKIGDVNGTSVIINKLAADTEYKFIVTAVIDGNETKMLVRDIVTVRTKNA